MITVSLFLMTAALATYAICKWGLLSPLGLHCGVSILQVIAYAGMLWGILPAGNVPGVSFRLTASPDRSSIVLMLYFTVMTIPVLFSSALSSYRNQNTPLIQPPLRVDTGALLSGIFVINMAFAIHLINVNLTPLLSNQTYLTLVDPELLGISHPALIALHNFLAPIGLLTFFLFGYAPALIREPLLVRLFLVPSMVYPFIWKFAGFSRWAPMMVVGLIIGMSLSGRRLGLVGYVRLAVVAAAAMFLMSVALTGRALPEQGLAGLTTALSVEQPHASAFLAIFYNIASGGALLDSIVELGTVELPPTYKLLSFSPLLGSMDGWSSWVDYNPRLNLFTPYSFLGELVSFGPAYLLFGLGALGFCIALMNRAHRNAHSSLVRLACVPAYFALIALHFYPVRHCWRLLLGCTLLALLVGWLHGRRAPGPRLALPRPVPETVP